MHHNEERYMYDQVFMPCVPPASAAAKAFFESCNGKGSCLPCIAVLNSQICVLELVCHMCLLLLPYAGYISPSVH